jgi:hypothetical protein
MRAPGMMRGMQFSLQRLLASTTLMASGCGLMMGAWRIAPIGPEWPTLVALGLHLAGAVIAGAGFGNVLKHPWVGALYGIAFGLVALMLMPHHH